jgi:hypothetical protein
MGCRVCQRPSRAEGDVITIPVNLAIRNSSPLFSEVSYQYIPVTDFSPGFSHIAATGKELSDEMYMSPRITRRFTTAKPATDAVHDRPSAIGSAVADLIRSIANRDVTFFNGTVAINFL